MSRLTYSVTSVRGLLQYVQRRDQDCFWWGPGHHRERGRCRQRRSLLSDDVAVAGQVGHHAEEGIDGVRRVDAAQGRNLTPTYFLHALSKNEQVFFIHSFDHTRCELWGLKCSSSIMLPDRRCQICPSPIVVQLGQRPRRQLLRRRHFLRPRCVRHWTRVEDVSRTNGRRGLPQCGNGIVDNGGTLGTGAVAWMSLMNYFSLGFCILYTLSTKSPIRWHVR